VEINVDKISASEQNLTSILLLNFYSMILLSRLLLWFVLKYLKLTPRGKEPLSESTKMLTCVAVQTDHGLMTPIIPNVNLKVLAQILKEVKELAEKPKKKIETTRIPRRNIHHF
jgi:hypothetical protein